MTTTIAPQHSWHCCGRRERPKTTPSKCDDDVDNDRDHRRCSRRRSSHYLRLPPPLQSPPPSPPLPTTPQTTNCPTTSSIPLPSTILFMMLFAHPPKLSVLVARFPAAAGRSSSLIAAHPFPSPRAVIHAPSALDRDLGAPSLVVALPP
jgi:hypothetical protein